MPIAASGSFGKPALKAAGTGRESSTLFEPFRIPRYSIRYPVWLTATCRTSTGRVADVILSDLSTDGCGVAVADGMLKPGQLVVVRLQSLEGLSGKVVWAGGKGAGVKFERPLYGPVVEHLVRVQFAVVPPRNDPARSSARSV